MQSYDDRAARLEPQTLAFLQALDAAGAPPLFALDPAVARLALVQLQHQVHVAVPPAVILARTLDGGPAGGVKMRIVRPLGSGSEMPGGRLLPGIMYFHGGGWMLGDAETHDRLLRELVNATQAAIVFVDYDRAPEARFPVALEQAYFATTWVGEHGATIGVDTSRLAVAGDSTGGTLATTVAMLAGQRSGPRIAFQLLFYPAADALMNTATYSQFGDGRYWLGQQHMQWYWDCYTDSEHRHDPAASPLHASLEQLRGLPPALVITAENDVLRAEGEAYVHRLIEAGVVVTATRYLGTIHDFVLLNALAGTPAARAAINQASAALRNAFAR
ncbi:MAG: alpha/beta hydrolase [Caldilineaceae bacterium]